MRSRSREDGFHCVPSPCTPDFLPLSMPPVEERSIDILRFQWLTLRVEINRLNGLLCNARFSLTEISDECLRRGFAMVETNAIPSAQARAFQLQQMPPERAQQRQQQLVRGVVGRPERRTVGREDG